MKKKIIIDDEFVLSRDRLSTHEAAAYLGMSWWRLTDGLRNNEFPFGTAKLGRTGTQYIYTIYAEACYRFKHGETAKPAGDTQELISLFKEALLLMNEVVSKMEEQMATA